MYCHAAGVPGAVPTALAKSERKMLGRDSVGGLFPQNRGKKRAATSIHWLAAFAYEFRNGVEIGPPAGQVGLVMTGAGNLVKALRV